MLVYAAAALMGDEPGFGLPLPERETGRRESVGLDLEFVGTSHLVDVVLGEVG